MPKTDKRLNAAQEAADDGEPVPETERDPLEQELHEAWEELRAAQAMIDRLNGEVNAATKWAAEYERQHGPFKSTPRLPDFMISF